MTMQVTVQSNLSLLGEGFDHTLDVVDNRMQDFGWCLVTSVQITATKGASVVAVDHTIWVNHRHDFEYEFLTEHSSLWC